MSAEHGRPAGVAGAAALALLLAALAGCHGGPPPAGADPLMDVFHQRSQEEGLSREETSGKRLFVHYCATCHGEAGEGDGQNAYNLDPAPPRFADSLPQHPRTYWREVVVGGTAALGRSPLCPPWGRSLTDEQVDAIVDYLAVLARPAPGPTPDASPASSPEPSSSVP